MTEDALPWVEKYRPTSVGQLALSDEHEQLVKSWISKGKIPNLLLAGPAGCGKTTLAKILIDKLDCQDLSLNASNERGIDVVRNKIQIFVQGKMGARWNICFLDEADALTRDAQTALRNMMEQRAERSRFILTANWPDRIIDPLRSRCKVLRMDRIPPEKRAKVLASILKAEGLWDGTGEQKRAVETYAGRFSDLRRMINAAERSISTHGELQPTKYTSVGGEKLIDLVEKGNYNKLVELSKKHTFDHRGAIERMFWSVPEGHPCAAGWRQELARSHREMDRVADPVVEFLGTCSALMDM